MEIDDFTRFLGFANLLGAVHGLFLTFVLVLGRGRTDPAMRVLAAFIFSFSIVIGGTMLGALQFYHSVPHLIRAGDPFAWLLGPLLYLYVKTLREGRFRTAWLFHLTPFLLYTLWMIPDFFLLPAAEKIRFVEETMVEPDSRYWLPSLARLPYNAAYIVILLMLLKKHRSEVEQSLSNLKPASLDWAMWLVTTLIITLTVAFLLYLMALAGWIYFLQANYLIGFVMSVIVYAIGYRGITQKVLDKEMHLIQSWKEDPGISASVNGNRRLEDVYDRIREVMKVSGIWSRPDLNIQELADAAGQPRYLVSKAINERAGLNFHDFVNSYRVEAVKKRLTEPGSSHYTIIAIAMDCGFNTKSSFNAAFRKHTGQTPSAWKKSLSETFNGHSV